MTNYAIEEENSERPQVEGEDVDGLMALLENMPYKLMV